ncbi:HNH endonuclease [Corynebacterium bovis]|uniref:HNH endonuclease n=1 Tax=Corynebacterium bovis TaxID=36808 RepID=A0A3R8VYP9_9CORY|nr:HNH endonuclease [Corynebacterium bovis]RRO98516.1 HNH endonuclease [Corynebacterium bovis]RRQ00449.1 HNH endonuclease [Corynebacterium bovis]RRQ01886.1 HNH endonuclease [Corynebacterium bovis]RRQ05135.1 HNH endonuclease [Corynebacterium bovis]
MQTQHTTPPGATGTTPPDGTGTTPRDTQDSTGRAPHDGTGPTPPHGGTGPTPPRNAPDTTGRTPHNVIEHTVVRRWRPEVDDDDRARCAVEINRSTVTLARLCTPEEDDDVERHVARIAATVGVTRGKAMTLADIGVMMRRMPRVAALLERGFLGFEHMRTLATDTVALAAHAVHAVEQDMVALLTPRRDRQAVPTPQWLHRRLTQIVDLHDPPAAPKETPPPERWVKIDESCRDATFLDICLPDDEGREFTTVLRAVARTMSCPLGEALMHMCRQTAKVEVTLNVYRSADGGPVSFADGRLSAAGYRPTPAMTAFLEGRDGTCRFPSCTVPATRCEKDHIRRWNHADPAAGGPTDTANMHCLCHRHHELKTMGLWDVTAAADGTEVWSSIDDGHVVVTVPTGPLADRRVTYAERAERRRRVA